MTFFMLAVLLATLPGKAEPAADDVHKFVAMYKCEVVNLLERIHAQPIIDERIRYLILSADRDADYVQCALDDHDTKIHCEAASGFYDKGSKRTFSPEVLAVIAKQGFATDAKQGNFQFDLPIKGPETYDVVANRLLNTLYLGYKTDVDHIKVQAPLLTLRSRELSKFSCLGPKSN